MAGARGGDVTIDERALEEFLTSPAGPVGRYLATIAQRVTQSSKRMAPVSPHGSHGRESGHLRSVIGWQIGRDGRGLYADIGSPARTADGRNAPYGLFQNIPNLRGAHGHAIRTTPHLVPALREIIGSL